MAEHLKEPISATLDDLSWLPGAWAGEKGGALIEEYWSRRAGASMLGMFRMVAGDTIRFLEIITLEQERDSVFMYIKHFRAGLIGLEEKDKPVTFVLVGQAPGEVVFFEQGKPEPKWLVYRQTGADGLSAAFELEAGVHGPEDEYRFTRSSLA